MRKQEGKDPLEAALRRMGEPSWLILRVLSLTQPCPGIEIIRRVERLLAEAHYPYQRLDPSTLHYALKRMEEDGLVRCAGRLDVTVPGPRGTLRRELRPVYLLTDLGARAIEHRRALEQAAERISPPPTIEQCAGIRRDLGISGGL